MNTSREKLKKYLYNKLQNCDIEEKYKLLSEMHIATEEVVFELNQQYVFCEKCGKHFLKTQCKDNVVIEKEFEPYDEDDDNLFARGKNKIYTILYRICPCCGKQDLYDKIISVKTDE